MSEVKIGGRTISERSDQRRVAIGRFFESGDNGYAIEAALRLGSHIADTLDIFAAKMSEEKPEPCDHSKHFKVGPIGGPMQCAGCGDPSP